MQFNVLALLAVMATAVAAGETYTVTEYACPATTSAYPAAPTYAPSGTGVASTGGVVYPTSPPIPAFTGAASIKGVSALGMVVAGGVALFL